MVTGTESISPLDIVESTWLVKYPERILSNKELIGFRARALAKHCVHIRDMIERVNENK